MATTAIARSATRTSKMRCTAIAHAKEAGTASVNAAAARSYGSGLPGRMLRHAIMSTNGAAPSTVPKNATRSRRRAFLKKVRIELDTFEAFVNGNPEGLAVLDDLHALRRILANAPA